MGFSISVALIVFRMKILAGRRNRFVPQIVPNMPKIHVAACHIRTGGMSKPMSRGIIK
jgi:hypothetical protein